MLANIKQITRTLSIIAFLIIFAFSSTQAQEPEQAEAIICENISRTLQGATHAIINQPYSYDIQGYSFNAQTGTPFTGKDKQVITTGTLLTLLGENTTINYELFRNNKSLVKDFNTGFTYTFTQVQNFTLHTNIQNEQCSYKITKDIQVYETIYTYIGKHLDNTQTSLIENTKQSPQLFFPIPISDGTPSETLQQQITNHLQYIQDSNYILINTQNYNTLLQIINPFITENKHIIIVTEGDKSITKKFLAAFVKQSASQKVYLLGNKEEFLNVLVEISVGQQPKIDQYLISFDAKTGFMSLGHIIDYLIYHGFPMELIGMLLSMSLAIAFIVFRRQIIGLNAFNIFYPLLFAGSIHILGIKTTFALLFVAGLSHFFVNHINKKMTLLSSARLGLTLIFYFIISLLTLQLFKRFGGGPQDFSTFGQFMFIVPYIVILMIGNKLFAEKSKILSWPRITQTAIFILLSFIIYTIYHNQLIQKRMLIHPNFIIVIALIIIIMGRYTGLQATEYIRFLPLIKYELSKKKISDRSE